ncbi:MAG TPA: NGG1p interacting factor NIF3 [Spirochaetota bacterium]|nr:NGG1p interacting factor NIF3 [Spirochaetota bacterium]HOS31615.1 NGG1p interacting factor NIF3 [Spirochaetota bacterium]HOS54802.1 NGG1p interacting factor NIF3 [Spirochaetota bacterium]HPK63170.1 NGG1p interacting factor NIF3 [Spirochaetota bacterium]HQF77396.1 NGG1p interacting factor NIF3 [Spirochaetota bacterium]
MYVLVSYVPESHLETLKKALFDKGAGKYKNYDMCCWEVKGFGQFRPLKGSFPYIGNTGEIEKVDEYRIELICKKKYLKKVIKELKKVHPYEEPAFSVFKIIL